MKKKENIKSALKYYLDAVKFDADVVLWYHIGIIAFSENEFSLARHSFENGLILQPQHGLSLNKLLETLYIIGDFEKCLNVIELIEKTTIFGKSEKIQKLKEEILDQMQIDEDDSSISKMETDIFKHLKEKKNKNI